MASRDFIFAGPNPSQSLFCPICQDIFQRPVITRECSHSYCKSCLSKAVQNDSSCPLCRYVFHSQAVSVFGFFGSAKHSIHIAKAENLTDSFSERINISNALPNLVLESVIGEIPVSCRRNCGWTGPLQNLGPHEDSHCPNRPVSCSGIDVGCKWNGPNSQIDGHQANCPFVLFRDFIQSTRVEIAALKTQLREQSHEIDFLRQRLNLSPEASHGQDITIVPRKSLSSSSSSSTSSSAVVPAAPAPQKTERQQIQEGVANLQSQKTLLGHTRGVTSLVYDGRFLFTGSHDTRIKVWDAQSGFDFVGELDGHDYTVWSLFLIDGKLYSGSADCTIREWELPPSQATSAPYAAKHVRTIKIPAANSKIYSICVREHLLFAASYKSIYVWDLRIGEVAHVLSGHLDSVWGVTIHANKLFSCSDDHSVRVWDLTTFSEVHQLQSDEPDTRFLSLAVGCGFIFAGTQDAKIKIWSLATYDLVATLSGHSWEVWQLALHPAGFLFSASFDHTIRCWTIPVENSSPLEFPCIFTTKAHKGYIHALLVHAQSSSLFTGSGDKSIKVWSYNGTTGSNSSESSS